MHFGRAFDAFGHAFAAFGHAFDAFGRSKNRKSLFTADGLG